MTVTSQLHEARRRVRGGYERLEYENTMGNDSVDSVKSNREDIEYIYPRNML